MKPIFTKKDFVNFFLRSLKMVHFMDLRKVNKLNPFILIHFVDRYTLKDVFELHKWGYNSFDEMKNTNFVMNFEEEEFKTVLYRLLNVEYLLSRSLFKWS